MSQQTIYSLMTKLKSSSRKEIEIDSSTDLIQMSELKKYTLITKVKISREEIEIDSSREEIQMIQQITNASNSKLKSSREE